MVSSDSDSSEPGSSSDAGSSGMCKCLAVLSILVIVGLLIFCVLLCCRESEAEEDPVGIFARPGIFGRT